MCESLCKYQCFYIYFNNEQTAGKYTVMADYERDSTPELSMKGGDMVQLVKEGDDGQWWDSSLTVQLWNINRYYSRNNVDYWSSCRLVRNLSTSKEGWITAANLIALVGKSTSCQSLTSSGIHTTTTCNWAPTDPHLALIFNICNVCVCNRGQRLGKHQHIIQLQRDLHQLLRHKTLNSSIIKLPSWMLPSHRHYP